jgi:hypothetical protein
MDPPGLSVWPSYRRRRRLATRGAAKDRRLRCTMKFPNTFRTSPAIRWVPATLLKRRTARSGLGGGGHVVHRSAIRGCSRVHPRRVLADERATPP